MVGSRLCTKIESVSSNFRAKASAAIEHGKTNEALQALTGLWHEDAGPATAGFIIKSFEKLHGKATLSAARVAILRSVSYTHLTLPTNREV